VLACRPRVEEGALQCGVFGPLCARFVDVLDHLNWQRDAADFVRLALPDELDFAFVLEQQEAVLVGEGFAFLE